MSEAAALKLVDLAVQAGEQVVTYITPELTARNSKGSNYGRRRIYFKFKGTRAGSGQ